MSRGSPIVSVRIPPLHHQAILASMAQEKESGKIECRSISEWMLWAAMERLERMHQDHIDKKKVAKSTPKKRRKKKS
jgi:hypothetical protein